MRVALIALVAVWLLFLPAVTGCITSDIFKGEENGGTVEQESGQEPHDYIKENARLKINNDGVSPGEHMLLEIHPFPLPPREVSLQGSDFDGEVSYPAWNGESLLLILGASYYNDPGEYEVDISIKFDQHEHTLTAGFNLAAGNYAQEHISAPEVEEDWTGERLQEEFVVVNRARKKTYPAPLWSGSFINPLEGRITSEYGATRYFNGSNPRRHNGVDIAVARGTPIVAANSGRVRLAGSLLSYGNTVIIDHGMGLNSSYLHLEELMVEEGQFVEKGEVIGTEGATGYATGSHLHWSVHLLHTPLNPWKFLKEENVWKEEEYLLEPGGKEYKQWYDGLDSGF